MIQLDLSLAQSIHDQIKAISASTVPFDSKQSNAMDNSIYNTSCNSLIADTPNSIELIEYVKRNPYINMIRQYQTAMDEMHAKIKQAQEMYQSKLASLPKVKVLDLKT